MPFSSELYVFNTDGEIIKKIYLPWVDMRHNSVSSTAMSVDGQHYAVGSSTGELRIYNLKGDLLHLVNAHNNGVSAMAFSSNGRYLATGSIDGDIILWEVQNNYEKILTYYVFEKEQFLVITQQGYYHASKGALDKFIYFKNGQIYRFDNYDLKFNRPDIIMDKLSLMDENIVKMYRKAYKKRLSRAGISDNMLSASFEDIPVVSLPKTKFYQKVKSSEFSFQIEAKSTNSELSKLFVYVNGSPLYGINGKEIQASNGQVFSETCSFQLNAGRNLVSVSVLDKAGVESLKQKFMVDYERSYSPTLHLMIIGVSEFKNKSMNLTYAAKDANDLKKQFKSKNPVYKKTKIYDLTNQNATKENVLRTLKLLQQTDPDDAVIIHVSSHGVLDSEMDYYLAMHDMDFNNPAAGGLSYDFLEEAISKIPSRKKILMLDACHSGELDKEEFEVSSSSIDTEKGEVKFRSVGNQVNSKSIGFDNSLELSKRIFSDMKRSSGTLVLSSAGAVEYALESDEWKNGVFTFSILQGLQEGEADLNDDGEITFSELREYVTDQVENLTEGGRSQTFVRTMNIVRR
ncbi:MAG: caspase family protein [Cyclobacteriaceae bacterium]